MAIHLDLKNSFLIGDKSNTNIQSVPFKIQADCDAKVTKYFESSVKDEGNYLKASFRGYPLKGNTLQVPEGYVGLVVHESIAPVTEKQERKFHILHKFSSMRYWNWDKMPTKNDKIVQALDWIDIAEALHSPIIEE